MTAGAETLNWWQDRTGAYTTLVTKGMAQRFGTTVKEIAAWQPGITTQEAVTLFQEQVLKPHKGGTRKVDVVVIALGLNDWERGNGSMKASLLSYAQQAKAAGIEVLLVTPLAPSPIFDANGAATPIAQVVKTIRDVAAETGVALVDVYAEWQNQATRGIAPSSQLHNTFNHPDESGMKIYADSILRFFPK
ncbi:MAG: SGNH/GDSL hydrolase family protein [Anaeromyxobacter sp.]